MLYILLFDVGEQRYDYAAKPRATTKHGIRHF